MSKFGEFGGAGESGGSGSNHHDFFAGWFARFEQVNLAVHHMVGGVALQAANRDRFVVRTQNAGPLAEFFDRADPSAGASQKVALEDHAGRTPGVFAGDFFDEAWNVNVRRAGVRAWRVVAEQTTVRFDHGLAVGEGWQVLAEVLLELRGGQWCV
jgi:hypothetical protein